MPDTKITQLNRKILSCIEIYSLFTSDYKMNLHGRGISRAIKESQKSVSNKLVMLARMKLLKYESRGSLKNYSLNLNNTSLINVLTIAEEYKAAVFISSNFSFYDFFSKLRFIVRGSILVFGSYARGDFSDKSDLDVAIIGDYSKKKADDILQMYPIKIRINSFSRNSFIKGLAKKDKFMLEILEHHIIIKGSSDVVEIFWGFYNG